MEKLMTTFAKSKKDIIKEALKEAKRAAVLEQNKTKLKTSTSKKRQPLGNKKISALPWRKLTLRADFRQSCHDLENLIVAEFQDISKIVSQKHIRMIEKLKDDLLLYVNNHRFLEENLVFSSSKKTKMNRPWQKQESKLSEDFFQSCDDLEHFIITGFDKVLKLVSKKHKNAIEISKDNLINYLENHHRKLKLLSSSSAKIESEESLSKTVISETIPMITLPESISKDPLSEVTPEVAASAKE